MQSRTPVFIGSFILLSVLFNLTGKLPARAQTAAPTASPSAPSAATASPTPSLAPSPTPAVAAPLTAVDMMVVIDNSCSMFPAGSLPSECTSFGSDIDFLRIRGADLFFARLGFAEPNEASYQAGAISLGDDPVLLSPLAPLSTARDALSGAVANPKPQVATKIVPALEMAYQQVLEPGKHKPGNHTAIVLFTDGIPSPAAGQSEMDLENLVESHPDVPLFIMLLSGGNDPSTRASYAQYLRFWQRMQTQYGHVFTTQIQTPNEIESAYNRIMAQLQATIPASGMVVYPSAPLQIYVGEYVDKLVITISHPKGGGGGPVQITDARGRAVAEGQPGVAHFRGAENPVEVFSISAPRLTDALKRAYWSISANDTPSVYIDRLGTYRINFLDPLVTSTGVPGIYSADARVSLKKEMLLRFNLVTAQGEVIKDAQPIKGRVVLPDGTVKGLNEAPYMKPDPQGVYELRFNLATVYPQAKDYDRLTFSFEAGSTRNTAFETLPVSRATLVAEVGQGPYVTVDPSRVLCDLNQPASLTVTIGDYGSVVKDTVRVGIDTGQGETPLAGNDKGQFTADLTSYCRQIVSALSCDTQPDTSFSLRVSAQTESGYPPINLERKIYVHSFGPICTPLPTVVEAAAVLPTPTPPPPTPVPDTDGDGILDPADTCPQSSGWARFNGCPPPAWLFGLAGGLMLGTLSVGLFYGWNWLRLRGASKLPEAYILASRRGRVIYELRNIQEIGREFHTGRILIGGSKKRAHIVIEGLQPVEFAVVVQGEKIFLADPKTLNVKGTFRQLAAEEIPTSVPDVTLVIGTNPALMNRFRRENFA